MIALDEERLAELEALQAEEQILEVNQNGTSVSWARLKSWR